MEINLVAEAIKFMIFGMLIVFVFLAVMVELMKLQAKLINKYFPEKAPEAAASSPQVDTEDEARRVAAIVAAIAEFRKNKS